MKPRARLYAGVALALCCIVAAASADAAPGNPPLPVPTLNMESNAAQQPGAESVQQQLSSNAAKASIAEEQYQQALKIRDMQDATIKELKQAVKLLYAAAGIQHLSLERSSNSSGSSGSSTAAAGQPEFLTAASVRLVLHNDTVPHQGALKELIYVYREGDGVPVNPAIAHRLLLLLAELGSAEAMADAGFHAALGVEPVAPNSRDQLFRLVPPDVPAALVHYMFAASAGDPVAQMTLGYRHLLGIDVPKSCQTAVLYYSPVAERVLQMAQVQEGLPQIKALRLSYKTAHTWRPSSEQEVLHYQRFADFGNADAARAVAHMLSHGAARDYGQAVRYLQQAAAAGDPDAMAHLGHIYANGRGVPQDNATAVAWLYKAAEQGHASGFFGLGYMHMTGQGAEQDHGKALRYFTDASQAASITAWAGGGDVYFYLGLMHLRGWGTKPDVAKAAQMWDAASRAGHLLASYNLAHLHLGGHTRAQAPCKAAAALLKRVAEKGFPAPQEANEDFQAGDYEWALLNYLKAAEMGQELGQSNAAWMLTEGYGYEGPEAGLAAVQLYKRAAAQGNHEALLRVGDGYWYGKGVPRDWSRAAQMYGEAAKHHNAQALFNMGLLHQFGAGLPRDFHLAKRCYDRSLTAQPEANLAVTAALAFLRLHQWWEGVQGRAPPFCAGAMGRLFGLVERSLTGAPAAHVQQLHLSPVKHGTWVRIRGLLSLDSLFDALDDLFELGDNLELTMAAGLLLLLVLVLWRRRTLRHQNQARFVRGARPDAR
ncbi:hypothetical protein D9Q98_005614 [Chlorella vulgaris]|uniref:Uncharacterized protein n=1 Tax=Chlorella vulgaris TaxID=3077 RepID=A0A9D4TMA9_CHLVU|nr:hypothetical protein D9Q98_005614 [Chlorella vulgaris]